MSTNDVKDQLDTAKHQGMRHLSWPSTASRRRGAARAAALSLVISAAGLVATVVPAYAAAPPNSVSYYVTGYSTSWAYNAGCSLGQLDLNRAGTQRSIAILEFGAMYFSSSSGWMMTAYSGSDMTISSARAMVQEFGHGYWVCTGSDLGSTVYVGLGTNNSAGTITWSAGLALAQEARTAWDTMDSNWPQSHGMGANDFESWGQGSSLSTASNNWIDGYNSYSNKVFFVNCGSADGCPTSSIPSATSCNPGLPAETIWRVSWSGIAWPLPEIYTTTGSQAKQWKYLSLYSYTNHGGKLSFAQGLVTQYGACQQVGGCSGTNNTPSAGWDQLNTQLDSDSRTAENPGPPTDISWK
jgi:hypothetical protein